MEDFYAQVPTPIFEACAGKTDQRPVLTGVLVEYASEGFARFTAADGYILASVEGPASLPNNFAPTLVPGSFIKTAYTRKRTASYANRLLFEDTRDSLSSTFTPDKVRIRNVNGDVSETTTIQGTYPDWRKLIPWRDESDMYEGWYMSMDPKLISRLCKAVDTDTFTVSIVTPSSPGVIATGEHDAIGVIMPKFANPDHEQLAERATKLGSTTIARLKRELAPAEHTIKTLQAKAQVTA